jgi:hypothetical protein
METSQETQATLLDGLGIVEKRGFAIYEQVLDAMCNAQNLSTIRDLVCDLDLDTKELVFASYVVGKLNSMSEEEIARIIMLRDLKNIAQSIVDSAEDNSENNFGI